MALGLSTANLANKWLDMMGGTAFTAPANEAADLVAAGYAVAVESAPESAAVDTKPTKRAAAKPEKRG